MLTRQNVVDLESSGKIEYFQESSFREKECKISTCIQPETNDGKWTNGRCSGLFFGNMYVKS